MNVCVTTRFLCVAFLLCVGVFRKHSATDPLPSWPSIQVSPKHCDGPPLYHLGENVTEGKFRSDTHGAFSTLTLLQQFWCVYFTVNKCGSLVLQVTAVVWRAV